MLVRARNPRDHERVESWYFSPAAGTFTIGGGARDALAFHRSLPGYAPTPLVSVPELARQLSVGRILVKDESSRLGLPAFKILGASWACQQVLGRRPGAELVSATDGNHGLAVAVVARLFGVAATVFVPAVMLDRTAHLIESEGARVIRTYGDYDVAVHDASDYAAAASDRALVQDVAWPGYEQVPAWIVEGYETMLFELDGQLPTPPDLVVVPVGVGSLAEAVVRHYRRVHGPRPRVLAVEPNSAACLLESLRAGYPVSVATGNTVMAGLNCGTVSGSAWPVLSAGLDAAVTVTDDEARRAVADLEDAGMSSGPCGAATLAAARATLGPDAPAERREALQLSADAVVVLLSTEANDRPPPD
jgi:diaminopropionate ammonia-lyase